MNYGTSDKHFIFMVKELTDDSQHTSPRVTWIPPTPLPCLPAAPACGVRVQCPGAVPAAPENTGDQPVRSDTENSERPQRRAMLRVQVAQCPDSILETSQPASTVCLQKGCSMEVVQLIAGMCRVVPC